MKYDTSAGRTQGPANQIKTCIVLTVLGAILALATPSRAIELLDNGTFDQGLDAWKMAPALADWNPLQPDGTVNLHPPGYGYQGLVLYQNLNVSDVAGRTVAFSMHLQMMYAPAGQTVAVYLDYALTNGTVKRVKMLNPSNESLPGGLWTNLVTSFAAPTDAARLIRLAVAKAGDGEFYADRLSLAATNVTVGAVPQINRISPSGGAYQSQVTIEGTNFGASPGQVWIGGTPVDFVEQTFGTPLAQVVTWNNTQVVARVVEPVRSGAVNLVVDGVESRGAGQFTVTSPNFIVDVATPEITAIRGETATLLLRVLFLNGFQSQNGVNFMIMDPPGLGVAGTPPLKGSGGFSFAIATAGLANGTYRGVVQSLEDNSYARFSAFKLNVVSVTNINFNDWNGPVTSVSADHQGEFYVNHELINHLGQIVGAEAMGPPPALPVTVTSGNPNVVQVAPGHFGPRYFAVDNGSTTLTFRTPDGYSESLPVTVNVPASPKIATASVSPGMADNSGHSTNVLFWQGSENLGWIGYEGLGDFSFDGLDRDNVNLSATWTLPIPAGTVPGVYLFHALIGDEWSGAKRFLLLTVVNAATHGQIAGSVHTVGASEFMHAELIGDFELYDASTGNPVATNFIQTFGTTTYTAAHIAPGTYRVRYAPYNESQTPQWYPNAASFAQAADIQVQAGTIVSNIDFYLGAVAPPPEDLPVPPPVFTAGSVDFNVKTVPGVTYYLEYKNSLSDPQWTVAQTITGDGGSRVLADAITQHPQRFYRLRMVGQ